MRSPDLDKFKNVEADDERNELSVLFITARELIHRNQHDELELRYRTEVRNTIRTEYER